MINLIDNLIFYANSHVQGSESQVPGIYIVGHPPTPPEAVYRAAFISAVVLLILAGLFQHFLKKKFLTPGKAGENGETPPIRYKSLKTALIIIAVVLFYFISLEAVLQVYVYYHPYQEFIPDPQAHWKINPAIQRAYDNSGDKNKKELAERDGLLDWEYTRQKDEKAYRILCYGDSQTMATPWVGSIYLTFPKLLQDKLMETFMKRDPQVINMGVSGYSSYQGLLFFKNIGLLYRPDCVIIGLGFHDAGSSYAPDKEVNTDRPMLKKLRSLLYRSQIYLLIRKRILTRRATGESEKGRPVFRRVSIEDYRENLREFVKKGKEKGIRVVFLTVPQMDPGGAKHLEYVETMRKAAKDLNIQLIDGVDAMSKIPPGEQSRYFVEDGVHFSREGNRFMANLIFGKLKPVLEDEFNEKK